MKELIRIIGLIFLLTLVCGFACAETVELPASLTIIRAEAFAGDTSVETVIVPEGVIQIGEKAFANSGLKLIRLPSTLQTIAADAFAGLGGLNATAPEDSYAYNWCLENNIPVQSWLQTTPASHFQYDAYTFHGVQGWKIDGCNTQLADVVVPNEIEGKPVLFITEEYHEQNEALRSIYYPDTAVLIETGQAKSMISVNFPSKATAVMASNPTLESVTIRSTADGDDTHYITAYAFKDCPRLKSVVLSDDVRSIGNGAFQNCASLAEINFPRSLQAVFDGAFDGCTSLRKIDGVYAYNSVEPYAFRNCKSLESLILLGDVSYISSSAFEGCENLTLTVMPGSDTIQKCDSLGLKYVVADFGYETNYQIAGSLSLIAYAGSDTEITVPAQAYGFPVSGIAYEAFKKNETVTSVTVAEGVSEIGMYAFRECPNLKTVILPDSVTTMKSSVFYKSTALEKVVLPSGLTAIPDDTFYNCTALKETEIPANVASIGKNAFAGCASMEKFELPAVLTEIKNVAFSGCASVKEFDIPDGVTTIGASAFHGCTDLERVSLPDGLLSIGDSAFMNCGRLTGISVPDSVSSIGKQCFQGCAALKKIHLPANLTEIPYFCFWDCYNLKFVNIPESVTAIGMSAFANCSSLDAITLPASLTSLGDNAFMSSTNHNRRFAVLSQSSDISYSARSLWMTKENPVYCYRYTGAEAWAKECGFDVAYLDDKDFAAVGAVSLPESMRLAIGETDWIPLSIFPDLGDPDAAWISKNGDIAAVSNGRVTAKSRGKTEITVTVGGKTASMPLNVYLPATSFDLSASEITIEVGGAHPLFCTNIAPEGAEAVFSYKSSNTRTAVVDANGLIMACTLGDVVITVTSDSGVVRNCVVHIVRPAS